MKVHVKHIAADYDTWRTSVKGSPNFIRWLIDDQPID